MRIFDKIALRIRSLLRRDRVEHDLTDEIRFHLEKLIEENVARGMTPEDGRYAAVRELGGLEQIKEECRDMRRVNYVENFVQDIRYGLRMLAKNPGFTTVAILTLALGIGANTAIFSAVYAVLLRPLPFARPGQLVRVFEANDRAGISADGCSYAEFKEWQRQNHVFSGMAAEAAHELTLTGRGEPTVVRVGDVTADFFSVLGVPPLAGRAFRAGDDDQGAAPVVVLSNDLWRIRFASDPGLIGSTIELDKRPFTVIGVMPATFRFSFQNEGQYRQLWIPIVQDPFFGPMAKNPIRHFFSAIARLKPGVSEAQEQGKLEALGAGLWPRYRPGDQGWSIRTATFREAMTEGTSAPLLILLATVGLVLLIACANVANLLLARATTRAKEFAIRAALGASRERILRQLLTESAVLGLGGAALGIGLAYWGVRGLSGLLPPTFPRADSIRVDGSVLAFALLLALGSKPAVWSCAGALRRRSTASRNASGKRGASRRRRGTPPGAQLSGDGGSRAGDGAVGGSRLAHPKLRGAD